MTVTVFDDDDSGTDTTPITITLNDACTIEGNRGNDFLARDARP